MQRGKAIEGGSGLGEQPNGESHVAQGSTGEKVKKLRTLEIKSNKKRNLIRSKEGQSARVAMVGGSAFIPG